MPTTKKKLAHNLPAETSLQQLSGPVNRPRKHVPLPVSLSSDQRYIKNRGTRHRPVRLTGNWNQCGSSSPVDQSR